MSRKSALLFPVILLALSVMLSACASNASRPGNAEVNDPLESINRQSFENNSFIDRLLFRPLAELYRVTVPPGIRVHVASVVSNMREPVIFVNDLLQGDFTKAAFTFDRFSINTVAGVGGLWDIAGAGGIHQQTGDFGQTLAVWGFGEGPYLMLPIYGPSDVRDAIGFGVDLAMSPWQYIVLFEGGTDDFIHFEAVDFSASALIRREQNIESYDTLRAGAIDPYARLRSAWYQYRHKQLGIRPGADEFEDYQ